MLLVMLKQVTGEIPNCSNLATTSALTAVENKIHSVSNLVKKLTIIRKLLITAMINILLLQNLISLWQKFLL